MIASVLAAAVAATTPLSVTLPSQHGWALVSAIEREVGGRYILTGLKDGGRICRQTRGCIADGDIGAAVSAPAQVSDVGQLLAAAQVFGTPAQAVVSLRGAREIDVNRTEVFASIYDRNARQWKNYVGILSGLTNAGDTNGGGLTASVKLMSWREVSVEALAAMATTAPAS